MKFALLPNHQWDSFPSCVAGRWFPADLGYVGYIERGGY